MSLTYHVGSRYDLLRNETLYTGGEIIIQIVRDVAQGLRFLHASKPPILHGDLKAKNILIDSRFRAKVADFGLATKNNGVLTGTPFWYVHAGIVYIWKFLEKSDLISMQDGTGILEAKIRVQYSMRHLRIR